MTDIRLPASALAAIGITGMVSVSSLLAQSALDATGLGIVESVREVQLEAVAPLGLGGPFELAQGMSKEVVVRLDDGRAATIIQNQATSPEPGERVRVFPVKRGTRFEHAPGVAVTGSRGI
jgi:outer membrane lipoprotein SlyB